MSQRNRSRKKRVLVALIIITLPFILLAVSKKDNSSTPEKTTVAQLTTTTCTTVSQTIVTTQQTTQATTQVTSQTALTTPRISTQPYKAAVMYCLDDKKALYSYNMDAPAAPASLTKVLTACVALKYVGPDEVFTVGSEQGFVEPSSSICFIRPGHRLKMYDLVTGMLMASGNDASYTIAVSTARKLKPGVQMSDTQAVQYFCELMNDFAKSIGMNSSNFVNPDGWDNSKQYTTVSDLLVLTKYALSVPEIRTITATQQKYVVFVSGENVTWTNSNYLLDPSSQYYCKYAIGTKTGTTINAGNCLIAAFTKNEKTYISVVVGCSTDSERYSSTLQLLSDYTQ